jgi:exosortase A
MRGHTGKEAPDLLGTAPLEAARQSRSNGTTAIVATLLVLTVTLIINWDTTRALLELWWTGDAYSHGLLVLPLVLYVVWRQRDAMARLTPSPRPLGLLAVAGVAVLWLLSNVMDIDAGRQLAWVLMLGAVVWTLLGTRLLRELAFPLAFMLLTISAWDFLAPPLQEATATLTAKSVELLGIPVFRDNQYLSIPSGQFRIAEQCAGLRYLLASLAVGSLYAYTQLRGLGPRILFVLVAAVSGLLANVARVTIVIVAGHLTDMQHSLVRDHGNLGWVVFAVLLVPLFWFGHWLGKRTATGRADTAGGGDTPPGRSASNRRVLALAAVALLIISLPPAGAYAVKSTGQADVHVTLAPPLPPPGWSGPDPADGPWTPVYLGADASLLARYTRGSETVFAYLAHYRRERQGAELIYYANNVYDRRRWRPLRSDETQTTLYGEERIVRETEIQSVETGDIVLVWHWYQVGDRVTADRNLAKLLRLYDLLVKRSGSWVVVVATESHRDVEHARELLAEFSEHLKMPDSLLGR